MNQTRYSRSEHFIRNSLAEGVYAAIAENGGYAICNTGLIDLGGQILVFDTFVTPKAATDLQRFSIDEFGRGPPVVINSHYHNDHIWGNQVFAAGAQIISSARTRELIATAGMEELQWYTANSAQRLESLRIQYKNSTDDQQKKELLLWIGENGGVVFVERGLPVIMHSDGQIQKILPDLLEIGLTTLNPVQPEVLGHQWLHENFKGKVSFYGGVSTQTVLPYGSPAEVQAAVRQCAHDPAPEGTGLLIGPSHRMMMDIPLSNVDAMLAAFPRIVEP